MKHFSISAFTLIPGFTTVQAIYGNEHTKPMSLFLSGFYSLLSLLAAILVATVYGILYAVDVSLTQNIYMGAALCLTLLLIIVFCADMQSVTVFMLKMVTCNCGECNFWSGVKQNTTVPHFLLYPVLIILSPWLMILVKFRSIFPHNWFVKTQKLITSLGEAVWEASPQLTLQILIVLTTFTDGVSELQWMVIASSSLSLVIPAIEMYLQRNG